MKKYLLLIPALVMLVQADATITTFSRMKMMGGMMNTEVRARSEYRSNMKADDDTVKMTSIISVKPQHTGEITRLDKEVVWSINHGGKSYTEGPLKPPEPAVKTETKVEGTPDTTQRYRVTNSSFSVVKTDSSKTINGFPCTKYVAKWSLTIEEIKSGQKTTNGMTMVEWTTPFTDVIKQAQAEQEAYSKAYLAKLGITTQPEAAQTMGMAYLATLGVSDKDFSSRMEGFGTEMAKIQGYPIITDTKWSAIDSSKKTETAQPEAQPETHPGPFGMQIPNVGGMIANQLAPKSQGEDANVGFSAYTEVKAISVGATDDKDYLVPTGYKKSN
jgi:hypothetical protein